MTFSLEYHNVVIYFVKCSGRRSILASLARFAMLSLPFLLVSVSSAQINSVSGNSTATGRSASVAPPTSMAVAPPTGAFVHNGFAPPNSAVTFPIHTPHSPSGTHLGNNGHHPQHHTATGTAYYPYVYAVPVPYAVDVSAADTSDDDEDAEYQGGPTVFDRRGSGSDSYVPPSSAGPAHAQDIPQDAPIAQSVSEPAPEPPQPPTTLVFKDGHQVEVGNYAIVSQTLYDLTPGHPRKIALADLDLPATEKQNDDRGVAFQLPPSAQAN